MSWYIIIIIILTGASSEPALPCEGRRDSGEIPGDACAL